MLAPDGWEEIGHAKQLLVFFGEKIEALVTTFSGGHGLANRIEFLNALSGVGKGGDEFQTFNSFLIKSQRRGKSVAKSEKQNDENPQYG